MSNCLQNYMLGFVARTNEYALTDKGHFQIGTEEGCVQNGAKNSARLDHLVRCARTLQFESDAFVIILRCGKTRGIKRLNVTNERSAASDGKTSNLQRSTVSDFLIVYSVIFLAIVM